MTLIDDHAEQDNEEIDLSAPETRAAGRWNSAGVPGERSKDFKNALRRLIRMLGPMRFVLGIVLIVAATSAVLNVFGPRVLGHGTDIIIKGVVSHHMDFGALHHTLWQAVELYAASSVLSIVASYMLAGIIQRLMFKLRSDVETKVHALPLSYIDKQSRGDLLSRVTNDIDNVAQSLQQTLSQMLTSVLLLIGTAVMMITISPLLAAVALTTVPVSVWGMRAVARRSRPKFISQWKSTGMLNSQIEETFTGHAVVKAFGRQREVDQRFRTTNDELYESSFGAQFMSSLMQPLTMFMGNVQYVLVAVVGGLRVASGAITIGDIQAFIQYSRQFSMPLTQVASMMNVFQSGIASFERVIEFLDAEQQIADPAASENPPPVRGRIEFRDVSFSYDPDRPLIESLSLIAE
ncbi:MAG: ATP-binding cassette, subfamily multidrug efflux pump, partial [Actinomycetota bacterium]|nr:ATP-binding cassette, subfamily multidrug efflux pump [Actinomycetota bacterium]